MSEDELPQRKRNRDDSDENAIEESNSETPNTFSHDHQLMQIDGEPKSGPSSPKIPKLSITIPACYGQKTIPDNQPSKFIGFDESRCTGLRKFYHGIAYQVQWMMVVALEAKSHSSISGFTFKTEEDDEHAGKFDDLVWHYKDLVQQNERYNFLQAKHKLDINETISKKDLLKPKLKMSLKSDKTNARPFVLEKYFVSYRDKIKVSPKYQNGEIENLIIATNIDLDHDLKNSLEKPESRIPVLDVAFDSDTQNKACEYWKFKKGNSAVKEEIINNFEDSYDLIKLAKTLRDCVLNSQPFILTDHLNSYRHALYDNVVNDGEHKFSENFINGENLSRQAMYLREAFFQEAFMKQRKSLNMDFKISSPEALANEIVQAINSSRHDVVKIERRSRIMKDNIERLRGPVLIERNGNIQFNPRFWTVNDNELPEDNLIVLRNTLKSKLTVEKLKEVKFTIPNFKTYKEILLDEEAFWEGVKGFNRFASYANVTSQSKDLPDHSLNDIQNDIEDFFNKLVFAVNYTKARLNKIVTAECKEFEWISQDSIAHSFQIEIAKALDMNHTMEGKFISTGEGVSQFFDKAKCQRSHLRLVGRTLEYREKIREFGITFIEEAVELRQFLTSSDKQVFNLISSYNTKLCAVKVNQALNNNNNNYILPLSSLLKETFRTENVLMTSEVNLLVIECDSTDKDLDELYNHLASIIQQNNNKKVVLITQNDHDFAKQFKYGFHDKYVEGQDEKYSFIDLTVDSQTRLLEDRKIIFQGKEEFLGALLDNERLKGLIDADVLFKLINNDKIEIGKAPYDLGETKYYYVNRTFNRRVFIKKDFKRRRTFYTTYNSEDITGPNFRKDQDLVLISNKVEDFKILCNKYQNHNIHWLKSEYHWLEWQQSHGTLSKIREFVNESGIEIIDYSSKDLIFDINDRVVIIAAGPGMGKSTLLTHLATQTKSESDLSTLWIARINLLDYASEFNRWEKTNIKINKTETIKFLYRAVGFKFLRKYGKDAKEINEQIISSIMELTTIEKDGEVILRNSGSKLKGLTLLEIELFNYFYNRGRIALLFDGFDEISPYYKDRVIELLEILKGTKAKKLWITTRPYSINSELEDKLGTFSYNLNPFFVNDQKEFLKMFWKRNLNIDELIDERFTVFTDELLKRFSRSIGYHNNEFMGIALHVNMIAKVFQSTFNEFYYSKNRQLSEEHRQKLSEKLNLVTLYERFIDIKFYEIRFGEKKPGINVDDPDERERIERDLKELMESHQKLALYRLFGEAGLKELFSDSELNCVLAENGLIAKIKSSKERNGIVIRVTEDTGLPEFIHPTFAEYFAALWLADDKNFKQPNVETFLRMRIMQERNAVVRKFFDLMLSGQSEIHVAVLNNDKETVKGLLEADKSIINRPDKANRTALHLAAAFGYEEVAQILLDCNANVNVDDKIFHWSPLTHAAQVASWNIVESIVKNGGNCDDFKKVQNFRSVDKKGVTLLRFAISHANIDTVRYIIGRGADVNAEGNFDDDYNTLLHFAAQKGDEEVVKDLLDKGALVDHQNRKGRTPVKLAYNNEKIKSILTSTQELFTIIRSNELNEEEKVNELKRLIANGAIVNAKSKQYSENTSLNLAAEKGYMKVINCLVENGAKLTVDDFWGKTALHWVAEFGHLEIVEYFIDKGVNFTFADNWGWTPLHFAAKKSHLDVVKYLAGLYENRNANFNTRSLNGRTAFHMAVDGDDEGKSLDVVQYLIEYVKVKYGNHRDKLIEFINTRDYDGTVPLMVAVNRGYVKIVNILADFLKDASPDSLFEVINADDVYGTALYKAVKNDRIEMVDVLLEYVKTASPDRFIEVINADNGDGTALYLAVKNDKIDMVKILLKNVKIASPTGLVEFIITNNHRKRPLHLALTKDSSKSVQQVRNEIVDILLGSVMTDSNQVMKVMDARDSLGRSILHIAVENDKLYDSNHILLKCIQSLKPEQQRKVLNAESSVENDGCDCTFYETPLSKAYVKGVQWSNLQSLVPDSTSEK